MPEPKKPSNRIRELIGIFLLVIAFIVFISLVTWNQADYPDQVHPANAVMANKAGALGAAVSKELFWLFGSISYVMAAMLALWGGILLFRTKVSALVIKIVSLVLFLGTSLIFFGLITPADFKSVRMESFGGVLGHSAANLMTDYFGSVGAYPVTLFVLLGSLLLATDWLLWDFILKVLGSGGLVIGKIIQAIAWFRQQRERKQLLKQLQTPTPAVTPAIPLRTKEEVLDEIPSARIEEEPEPPVIKKVAPPPPKPERPVEPAPPRQMGDFHLPPLALLEDAVPQEESADEKDIKERMDVIEGTLRSFGIEARVVNVERGPVVTKFELELAPGISVHKVAGMTDDLSIALKAPNVMIVAPIPGKSTVGIEVPNTYKGIVRLKELIVAKPKEAERFSLSLFMGKDAVGNPIIRDLDEMPHMLIAGTTGSGKSVCVASSILSMLMNRTPDELKLLLIDPKMVELSVFKDIPHLISPVVTDMRRAPLILKWLVRTMDERYELFLRAGVKKIDSYNRLSEEDIKNRLSEDGEEPADVPLRLPYIVVLIDELADLMMAASEDVETAITRLAQKSRAVGIHLMLATQRPSVDVITGLIKSNMPARVSFKVASKIDSRTILDRNGAERLLGKGDMLIVFPGTTDLTRGQCTFVSENEIRNVCEFLKKQAKPVYDNELVKLETQQDIDASEQDDLFEEAARIVIETQRGSVSLIQRRLNIGYSRAARLVEMMAKVGIVGEYKNSKAREVMMNLQEWENAKSSRG